MTGSSGCSVPAPTSPGPAAAWVLIGGLVVLAGIALKAPAAARPGARRGGLVLMIAAGLGYLAVLALIPAAASSTCATAKSAGTAQTNLTVAVLVMFMVGTAWRTGTEWIAIASTVVLDASLICLIPGLRLAHRGEYIDVLVVHGICTAVASGWSRALRGAAPAERAKASEAGRVLAGSWLVIIAIGFAGYGQHDGADTFLTDSTLIGLFIGGAIAAVLGSGYTKYAEARRDCSSPPAVAPDVFTYAHRFAVQRARRAAAWHSAYSPWF